jgi:hypothetical protein
MSILFYSPQCKYSNELITIIDKNRISIKKVNISTLKILPKFLEKVPTIVAEGVSQPLVGKQALDWVTNNQYFNIVSNNINFSKNIKPPFESELLCSNEEKPENNFCSIIDSTSLIFPTLKDFITNNYA